jgi:LacI family gluconate utilization system Gnt-I transcriptional repressor
LGCSVAITFWPTGPSSSAAAAMLLRLMRGEAVEPASMDRGCEPVVRGST